MTTLVLLFPLLLSAADLPKDVISVSARIEADSLEVGKDCEIVLDVQMKDGWSASDSGIPNAILQIKVPRSIQLEGRPQQDRRLERRSRRCGARVTPRFGSADGAGGPPEPFHAVR